MRKLRKHLGILKKDEKLHKILPYEAKAELYHIFRSFVFWAMEFQKYHFEVYEHPEVEILVIFITALASQMQLSKGQLISK